VELAGGRNETVSPIRDELITHGYFDGLGGGLTSGGMMVT
jgi:hypothetical protein